MIYTIIMAGGIGSRFWPQSRKARPKQFLNVFGEATLLVSADTVKENQSLTASASVDGEVMEVNEAPVEKIVVLR